MLRQRVITALVLVAILLPALFASRSWPFALITLVAIAAAAWEWARLNGRAGVAALVFAALLALACAVTLAAPVAWPGAPRAVWWAASVSWVIGAALVLRAGVDAWGRWSPPLRLLIGFVLLYAGWLALVHARQIGINFILSVLCLVWMADIAAYFGGRAFGRRKLAPSISPGKSWEGVWSGQLGVVALALVWSRVERGGWTDGPSLFALLFDSLGALAGTLALLALAGMSVVGDLIESLIKRAAGAKDSSGLLPGHGGVLDRIDALLPVFPLALVFATR